MQNFKRIVLAIAMGASMFGCTKDHDADHRAIRIHFPVVNLILDPQKMEDAYSMAIVSQIHRGLFRYNTAGEVLNDLAESWVESPDHRSYKIKLKPSQFSDGTPISPIHVQMSFARMFKLGASMAGDIDYIAGSSDFKKNGDLSKFGVKPVGSDSVEFILSKPSAIFLKQLAVADCAILKLSDFHQDPNLTSAGGFSGPYKLISDLSNGEVTIQKWRPDKLDSPAPPLRITYFTTDKSPVTLALAGKTDTLDHDRVSAEDSKTLQGKGWGPTPTELFGEVFVVLNPDLIPEDARKLMFASVAIDSELSEVLQIFDSTARESRYRDLQKRILKKWTVIPLLFGSEASGLWSTKVKSLPEHPLGYHMLPMESLEMRR